VYARSFGTFGSEASYGRMWETGGAAHVMGYSVTMEFNFNIAILGLVIIVIV